MVYGCIANHSYRKQEAYTKCYIMQDNHFFFLSRWRWSIPSKHRYT